MPLFQFWIAVLNLRVGYYTHGRRLGKSPLPQPAFFNRALLFQVGLGQKNARLSLAWVIIRRLAELNVWFPRFAFPASSLLYFSFCVIFLFGLRRLARIVVWKFLEEFNLPTFPSRDSILAFQRDGGVCLFVPYPLT